MAISDPGGSLARPLKVVDSDLLEEYLRSFLAEEGVAEVVVGVPKTLGGEVGFQAEQVLGRLNILRDTFPAARFMEWDERFTTRVARSGAGPGARSKGRTGRRKRGAKKERVDHLAAAVMLQEYLDRRGKFEATRQGAP